MALVLNDRVKETSTSTGTGTINLAGAVSGFEGFVAGIGNSNTTYYAIANQSANEWEVGIGTITDATPDTLARTTVLSSSNSDSAVNFTAGTKDVFCTYPAGKAVFKDASDNTNFADDEKIQLGTGNDIQLYHDGGNSYLDGGDVGAFYIRGGTAGQGDLNLTDSSGGGRFLVGTDGGATELYHNSSNAKKLETIATGVQTTGTVNVNGAYAFPTADGNSTQILQTDGAGALTFVDKPTSGASAGFAIAMAVAL
tara:strand:+ start:1850 stop:2611 length:762 start_codon:yes stop_codon:yes gene_type:complete